MASGVRWMSTGALEDRPGGYKPRGKVLCEEPLWLFRTQGEGLSLAVGARQMDREKYRRSRQRGLDRKE